MNNLEEKKRRELLLKRSKYIKFFSYYLFNLYFSFKRSIKTIALFILF